MACTDFISSHTNRHVRGYVLDECQYKINFFPIFFFDFQLFYEILLIYSLRNCVATVVVTVLSSITFYVLICFFILLFLFFFSPALSFIVIVAFWRLYMKRHIMLRIRRVALYQCLYLLLALGYSQPMLTALVSLNLYVLTSNLNILNNI